MRVKKKVFLQICFLLFFYKLVLCDKTRFQMKKDFAT